MVDCVPSLPLPCSNPPTLQPLLYFAMSQTLFFKKSTLPINHLYLITRIQTAQLSTSPPSCSSPSLITALHRHAHRLHTRDFGSFLKWASTIMAASALGILCSSSSPDPPFLAFADSSTDAEADVQSPLQSQRFRSLFSKLSLPEVTNKFIFGDAYRRKIFFNYEKRLRLRSPPEKVFEYFASFRASDGELLMKPVDLMRAVVPVFPPSESNLVRDGYLSGERNPGDLLCAPSEFFMLFDVNGDGHISFKEYIFFVTLLSIPESSFSVAFKMFDINSNGEIDKDEFKKVMTLMRSQNRQGARNRNGLRTGFKVHGSVENGGLVEYFFGKDGTGRLSYDKFVQFMKDLHNEMLRLEFAHYDYKSRGYISARDFALSLVASADINHLGRLLSRVDELNNNQPHLSDVQITFEDFKKFAAIRRKLQPFSLALFSYGKVNGLLTRKDFQRAAYSVCGVALSENLVDIIFHVFDTNRDGKLSASEFIRVLHKRERDIAQPVEGGIVGLLSCCWNCKSNWSFWQSYS